MTEKHDWQSVRERLVKRRVALNEEIAAYPTPIPACDVQFNHLLGERARLNAELQRLDAAMAASSSSGAVMQFVESCPYLADAGGEKQQ